MSVVSIVDYGMGNLQSVKNAFAALGADARIAREPAALGAADAIVVPGVGAFGEAMTTLRTRGWVKALDDEVRGKGKPFLGLCLGMQLLATCGTEGGAVAGLGWIPATVTALSPQPGVRVPHIGWNDVAIAANSRMYHGLDERATFYFVHSYVLEPTEPRIVNGTCAHGRPFPASLECGRIWATQFHPEKSQRSGLRVLENFLGLLSS